MQKFIKAIGAGQKRARDLTRDEAREAMSFIVRGQARPEQLGAFLLALRMKGESADELAGFVDALRAEFPVCDAHVALDVDCHGDGHEGRTTVLAEAGVAVAKLGVPVLLRVDRGSPTAKHGLEESLAPLGLQPPFDIEHARASLASRKMAVLDLASYSPTLKRLVDLRALLGLRTAAQTLAKLVDPIGADTRVLGVFHAPYLESTARASSSLGPHEVLCVQALGGLPEPSPGKVARVARRDGVTESLDLRFLPTDARVQAVAATLLCAARKIPIADAAQAVLSVLPHA